MSIRRAVWSARTYIGSRVPVLRFLAGRHSDLTFNDSNLIFVDPLPVAPVPPDDYDRLIFLHIPKCGGSTIGQIVRACSHHCGGKYRHFPLLANNMVHPGWTGVYDGLSGLSPPDRDELSFVHGHFPFGVHEFFTGKSGYITFLRAPIAREVSVYNFAYQTGYIDKGDTLERLVESEAIADNPQTRMLAGKQAMEGACTRESLELAMANLNRHFALVGISEDIDFALRILISLQKWPSVAFYRRNVTKLKLLEEPSPGLQKLLSDYHSLDLILYETIAARWTRLKAELDVAPGADDINHRYLLVPPERSGAEAARLIERRRIAQSAAESSD